MPLMSIVILGGVLCAFGLFGVMLVLGDMTSGDLRRNGRR